MSTRGDRSRPAPDRAGDADAAKTSRRPRRDTGYVGESPADDDEVGRSIPRGDAAVEDVTVAMRHLRTVEEAEEATAEEEDRGAHADDERDDDDATATARSEPRGEWTTKPATETSWRGDGRVAAWLAERERKANKRALGPLRRARKELEWITRRRSAQIANYRRDRKIEIEEQREAMAQAKVASYGAAAKDGADVVTTNDRVGVIEDAAAVIERYLGMRGLEFAGKSRERLLQFRDEDVCSPLFLTTLLHERAALARQIGRCKRGAALPAQDPAREQDELAAAIAARPDDGFTEAQLHRILGEVIAASRALVADPET